MEKEITLKGNTVKEHDNGGEAGARSTIHPGKVEVGESPVQPHPDTEVGPVVGLVHQPGKQRLTLRITVVALYSATCVAAAYMLVLIPNVEFFSMLVFLGGLLFGRTLGSINGFVSALLYFVFNINGASPLPLLVVQLCSYTILGLTGGVLHGSPLRLSIGKKSQAVFGLVGVVFSLAYTITSDLVFSIVMQIDFLAWFLQGIVFTIILVANNAITFSMLLPLVIDGLDKHLGKILT